MRGGEGRRVGDVSTDEVTVLSPWNFPLTLLTPLDVQRGNNALSDGQGCTGYSGPGRCGPEGGGVGGGGVRGVNGMSCVDIGSLFFACSPHRLIFWHPKYSATFHQTTDRQPHLNGRNCTRESHRNPGLHTQIFKTFMLPPRHMVPDSMSTKARRFSHERRSGILKGQF